MEQEKKGSYIAVLQKKLLSLDILAGTARGPAP